MGLPAKTLKDAFNACDPAPLPPEDPRYVDLSAGRGIEGSAVEQCLRRILWADRPVAQLFAGHLGCGKSTELKRLCRQLEEQGYFPIFINAEDDIDLQDTQPPDILLMLIRELDLSLRRKDIVIGEKHLEDFWSWFAEVIWENTETEAAEAELRSEVELGGALPLFAKLLARLTGQIKTGTESKKLVRRQLDPQLSQLLERGRSFVHAARLAVQEKKYKDIVLIVDGLDKIALKDLGNGRTTHDVLFIERGELLQGFQCHTVVTIPISLFFSPKAANLATRFPDQHVVPMIKISKRDGASSASGLQAMEDLLLHRLDLDALFERDAIAALVAASGGHPRHLMILVRDALTIAQEPPIGLGAANRAVQRMVNGFARSIPDKHWSLLVEVHDNRAVKNDEAHQQMLFNLSVLEYQNDQRWCDVHPCVQRVSAFQEARERLTTSRLDR